MSNPPASTSTAPVNRHALTAVEKQRSQLEKLLKDPLKPAYVPPPPKEKTIRAAREMMKNVQGSSAGAGSGEFHVYKASRRREYERLKLLEEASQKEVEDADFEKKRRDAEELNNAKTSKNRAKRQKKKERSKMKGNDDDGSSAPRQESESVRSDLPIKKRRLVEGKELVFKKPGEGSDEEGDVDEGSSEQPHVSDKYPSPSARELAAPELETARITFVEED
ncbi:hypothetical protein B0H34DRAFT_795966 [Crassisporium funariophilum]|nr:hypothetical protein B0H34DRAFT_795966 [Crassisporium funariophilum]